MSKNYRKRYESGIRIMQCFLERNPGVVGDSVARCAWAHTYTGRGNSTLWHEKESCRRVPGLSARAVLSSCLLACMAFHAARAPYETCTVMERPRLLVTLRVWAGSPCG